LPAIDRFLEFLQKQKGSDLHLSAGRPPTIRLDGSVRSMKMDPLKPEDTERLFAEIMPEPNRREFEEDRDTDFAYEIPGVARFRVNIYHDRQGAAGAFRLIPTEVMTAEDLGLPSAIMQFCKLPKGLVLVTGPTGSGKSTTLAAMLDSINASRAQHIITIEDPIEFVHHSKKCLVHQREIGTQVKSFGRALRAALREDPDVVLVGEMRDLETAHIAIETAETGHLVFGTLHTTTAASTVDRLINQFPSDEQEQVRAMLSVSLKGVVAQTLLRRKGGGRAAAFEILVCTPAVGNCIREQKTYQIPSIIQTGAKHGMCTMNDSLLRLVLSGAVEPGEAVASTTDPEDLQRKLAVAGVEPEPSPVA
jgi:twitching motility protein PilT